MNPSSPTGPDTSPETEPEVPPPHNDPPPGEPETEIIPRPDTEILPGDGHDGRTTDART